jgi:uncharacterized protein
MKASMYEVSVPVLQHYLKNLSLAMDKAANHAQQQDQGEVLLLEARLSPDMLPLKSQIQMTCDFARRACAPLLGAEVPAYPFTEASFAALQLRLSNTLRYLESLPADCFEGSEHLAVTTIAGSAARNFTGIEYLFYYAMPNFFFHLTVAYSILRHSGVQIGKADFDQFHSYS